MAIVMVKANEEKSRIVVFRSFAVFGKCSLVQPEPRWRKGPKIDEETRQAYFSRYSTSFSLYSDRVNYRWSQSSKCGHATAVMALATIVRIWTHCKTDKVHS